MWVARDNNGKLHLSIDKIQYRDVELKEWCFNIKGHVFLPQHLFPNLNWEDEPIEIEFITKEYREKLEEALNELEIYKNIESWCKIHEVYKNNEKWGKMQLDEDLSKPKLITPPEGYRYTKEYLDAWEKNNNPNSLTAICYDGPILEPIDKLTVTNN